MSVHPITFVLAAVAVPAVIIGAGVIGLVVGVWYEWPIADWIWGMLP